MKVTFTRHGQSLANTLHIISNRDLPHPLTELGRQQALDLSQQLKQNHFERIYASPVPRALETGQILAEALQLPLEIEAALREYNCGNLEGRGDDQAWQIHQQLVQDWFNGQRHNECPPGGESFAEIQARMRRFLGKQVEKHKSHILCVSHGGTLVFGLPELLENIDFIFARQNIPGHTDLIEAEYRSGHWLCLRWGRHIFEG